MMNYYAERAIREYGIPGSYYKLVVIKHMRDHIKYLSEVYEKTPTKKES